MRTFAFVMLRAIQLTIVVLALAGVATFAACGLLFHIGISPVLTGSMRPTYGPGDAVITRLVDVHSLHPGQIAVFVPPGESAPYAHRLTSVTEKSGHVVVTSKGDANPVADRWHARLDATQVPVVVAHVPYLGRAMTWVSTPRARALAIGLVGLVLTALGTRAIVATSSRRLDAPAPAGAS